MAKARDDEPVRYIGFSSTRFYCTSFSCDQGAERAQAPKEHVRVARNHGFPHPYLFPVVVGALASLTAGALLSASSHEAEARSAPADRSAVPAAVPEAAASPLADVVAEQQREQPPAPRFVTEYGIRLEDEDHVRRFLNGGVRCMFWTGAYSDQRATVFELLRLRKMGIASPPIDYEVHHEQRNGADYVVVREHLRNRDGSDLRGMPGDIVHLYLEDVQRERFEHIRSTAEDQDFNPMLLREQGDPVSFLVAHSDAVCNVRRALPEIRAELARKQSEALAARPANGGGRTSEPVERDDGSGPAPTPPAPPPLAATADRSSADTTTPAI